MSDRFFLIPGNRLPLPAKCWCCGSHTRDCIDFGTNVEFFGAVLLCTTCVAEATTVLPQLPDMEKIRLQEQNTRLEKIIKDFRNAVDAVVSTTNDAVVANRVGSFLGDSRIEEKLAKTAR